ncbi:MAG: RNA polymerase sigma factor [Rubinisphaera brasiliensis]|uniref:RNA polymerase sigma factor n=1 Tax=Rubinisphaera brasiliensis (strain ATCC 49424 / DSM 5305 / JCM 21570 / IAM 15109 / NBRC 103401 / IFAM 1448) TaxID=756272 RepID=F0SL36_RUBBR|nr:sigma-70 family RNA polymerase sigma factor [Rubinisphaera brasiliensis]ADY60919.1 RNA polymerase, sigma subunit, SigW [Rubinisphaera brasiliensis DSM 5305]
MPISTIVDETAPSPAISDARLVEETRSGDNDAFRQLVVRYEKRLYRVIYRFVRDDSLAEDLAQETFLRVYENLDQFDVSRRFGPWLFRIGVNLTLDYLRKKKRRGRMSVFSEISPDQPLNPGTADPRERYDISEEVSRVIQEIPEKYRTILVLRDLEHFSTAEIAAIVNRKEATVRWRLAEARNRFKTLWTRRLGEHQPQSDVAGLTEQSDDQDE